MGELRRQEEGMGVSLDACNFSSEGPHHRRHALKSNPMRCFSDATNDGVADYRTGFAAVRLDGAGRRQQGAQRTDWRADAHAKRSQVDASAREEEGPNYSRLGQICPTSWDKNRGKPTPVADVDMSQGERRSSCLPYPRSQI
jgi:hypothetical protein